MKPMLSRKLIITNAALIACLLIVGGASVLGLLSLRTTIGEIAEEYEESHFIENVVVHITTARTLLEQDTIKAEHVNGSLDAAFDEIDNFVAYQETEVVHLPGHQRVESSFEDRVREELLAARGLVNGPGDTGSRRDAIDAHLVGALDELGALLDQMDVSGVRDAGRRHAARTSIMVAALTACIIVGAILMNVFGYRSVIVPLRKIRHGLRQFARGNLAQRLDTRVDQEFAVVADEFNRMASELETLTRNLEEKVEAKSRELVRSERLASVGFLAAGVAHEINNPLNIVTGYAEMGQKWLDGDLDDARRAEIRDAMHIIRQEAFRCKQIIQQLLSLSKMGDGVRGAVSLRGIAEEVTAMLSALEKYRRHSITLTCTDERFPAVWGNEPELRQVVLNLTVNALEALDPAVGGHVEIELSTGEHDVQLVVRDDGAGMSPETLERIFEPFFTSRTAGEGRGTGLGLSICHAIIESHGGTIRAESEGPDRGSSFVIALPVARKEVAHAV